MIALIPCFVALSLHNSVADKYVSTRFYANKCVQVYYAETPNITNILLICIDAMPDSAQRRSCFLAFLCPRRHPIQVMLIGFHALATLSLLIAFELCTLYFGLSL